MIYKRRRRDYNVYFRTLYRGLFNKGKWKLGGFDLCSNGNLLSDNQKRINLIESIPYVTCGVETRCFKDRPKLDYWMDENYLICISYKNQSKNLWLLFPDLYQLRFVVCF